MNLTKSETNNCIVAQLTNVRPHPNADKIKLATVLGTQVVVGLESKDGDIVLYFDSNLALSPEYLSSNNLYSNQELNRDKTKKGYFSSNGRVKCQKFRGEVSNGYVAETNSLIHFLSDNSLWDDIKWNEGDEFTHIDGVEICRKYIIPYHGTGEKRQRKNNKFQSPMFKFHWDTKQFMREYQSIPPGVVYVEEKIHGTSGRTGNVLCSTNKRWYQIWKPKEEWKVISGTRRVHSIVSGHMSVERKEIETKLAPILHKGETVYYEIFGHSAEGKEIQPGFSYDCIGGEYKVMLYRVTITTPDGYSVDLPRETVYQRAEELGLMKPIKIDKFFLGDVYNPALIDQYVHGNSAVANHMKEGVVIWFQESNGNWSALKHKSEEFLELESGQRDKEISDVEDIL
jgi:hypothetical protein